MPGFPQKFGRYELIDLISNGGMAEIYLARMLGAKSSASKVIAIKKILPDLSTDQAFVKMFENEIGLAMAMNHPNIVRIYDFGVEEGEYYMAMEYLHGKTLLSVSAQHSRELVIAPGAFSCYVVAQVCRALTFAHGYCNPVTKAPAGIIHRDISPHNVLIGYNGEVKLFDFGVAKMGSRAQDTEAGVVKGKPAYLSPEQVQCEPVDERCDIFSLGIVLWEQLTGRRLFADDHPLLTIKKVVEMEIVPPSSINSLITPAIDAIVLKALQRDKAQRYPCARDFGLDIERALQNEGVYYGEKQVRQHLEKIFGLQIDKENQELRSKFNYLVDRNGGHKEDWTEAHSSKTVTLAIRSEELQQAQPPSRVNFGNIALGLFLAMVGGWAAMMFQGEKIDHDPPPVIAAPIPNPPPLRNLAQSVRRNQLQPIRLELGPLDGLDVQAISLVQSSLTKRGDGPPHVTVRVTAGGEKPTTLVLSSVEAVAWQVSVERGARLDRVILNERGDEKEPSEVKLTGESVPAQIEYINAGFQPFGIDATRTLQRRPAQLRGNSVKIGSPEDFAFTLSTEICFQDALAQAQFVTGRCQPVVPR